MRRNSVQEFRCHPSRTSLTPGCNEGQTHRVEGEENKYSLPFYAGVGGQAGVYFKHPWPDDRTDVGVRLPVGMSVVIPDNPVEIYFEVAPDVAMYHDDFDDKDHAVFFVDGQIGVRYYF